MLTGCSKYTDVEYVHAVTAATQNRRRRRRRRRQQRQQQQWQQQQQQKQQQQEARLYCYLFWRQHSTSAVSDFVIPAAEEI